jgi:hypothetical protein
MKQREVQDSDNTRWVCVEALSAITESRKDIEEKIQDSNGNVTVVCTPSGGAQTVRLQLPPDWLENTPDAELLKKIENK